MQDELKQIAERIAGLREIEEVSAEEMAALTGKDVSEYLEYEEGKRDFSFSFLYTVAQRLHVDITELLTGENARLHRYAFVRAGRGLQMERRRAYKYQHLAAIFKEREMEPFLVVVEPKDVEAVVKHAHAGQEFNYILDGSMTFFIGDTAIRMYPGDSVYFDAQEPHAMRAEDGAPCSFLAVIAGGAE